MFTKIAWQVTFAVACIALQVLMAGRAAAVDVTMDSTDLIKKGLAEKTAVLLDVREESEWNDGHLKDARSLPLSKLKEGLDPKGLAEIAPKDKIIYCHCKTGRRAKAAAEILEKAGYDVRPLRLGYDDLLKEGFSKAEK